MKLKVYCLKSLLILFLFESHGQNIVKHKIVGEWQSMDVSGDSGLYNFRYDQTMEVSSQYGTLGQGIQTFKNGRQRKILLRYEVNEKVSPGQIDFLFYENSYDNLIGKREGIFELLSDNVLRFAINYDTANLKRPKMFNDSRELGILVRKDHELKVTGCDRYKNGKFKYVDVFFGTILIERHDDIQVQTDSNDNRIKFKVKWLSDCSYEVTPIEVFYNNVLVTNPPVQVLTVDMIAIKSNSYVYVTTLQDSNIHLAGELIQIQN